MTATALPYGHPSTIRKGPFRCKGYSPEEVSDPEVRVLNAVQKTWMLTHKPTYYTGLLMCDLPHLPPELRNL